MDTKLLCPTLSVVLVKTIKALCEINIKYDSKLEITGSLHVRSDGQKVLTCLLDEETVKGQYDAARVAELAARLSMAAASFPFTHLQMSANVNHSQPTLFSSMQGDVHLLGSQQPMSAGSEQTVRSENEAAAAVFQHGGRLPDGQQAMLPEGGMAELMRRQEESRQAVTVIQPLEDARTRQNSVDSVVSPAILGRKRHVDSTSKAFCTAKSTSGNVSGSNYTIATPDISGLFTQPGGQNHVRLPDIQTLAHSLPKIPGTRPRTATVNPTSLQPPLVMPQVVTKDPVASFSLPPVDPSGVSPAAMPSLEPMTGVEPKLHHDVGGADGSASNRKKFQCMFCGIFLSTKCYLKNHINAMHTRARVYPCELCERYFYSAGALRIHKLRNHWQDSKKHVCTHCGETFLLPIELRKHVVKKHVGADDHQLAIDSVEMKLEDNEMPQLQPEDVAMATTPTSACYRGVGELNNPLTPNNTPPSLEADGRMVE